MCAFLFPLASVLAKICTHSQKLIYNYLKSNERLDVVLIYCKIENPVSKILFEQLLHCISKFSNMLFFTSASRIE